MDSVSCSWLQRFSIIMMSVLLNLIYRFKAISIKTQKASSNNLMEIGENRISNTILKENKRVEELELFNLQASCKATVIRALYYLERKRETGSVEQKRKPRI